MKSPKRTIHIVALNALLFSGIAQAGENTGNVIDYLRLEGGASFGQSEFLGLTTQHKSVLTDMELHKLQLQGKFIDELLIKGQLEAGSRTMAQPDSESIPTGPASLSDSEFGASDPAPTTPLATFKAAVKAQYGAGYVTGDANSACRFYLMGKTTGEAQITNALTDEDTGAMATLGPEAGLICQAKHLAVRAGLGGGLVLKADPRSSGANGIAQGRLDATLFDRVLVTAEADGNGEQNRQSAAVRVVVPQRQVLLTVGLVYDRKAINNRELKAHLDAYAQAAGTPRIDSTNTDHTVSGVVSAAW